MLKKISKMKSKHQIIFAIIVGFAVISFWRGVWGLMDEYLLPNNYTLSLWISVILGVVILILTGYATKELM
jgi:quinol-cytochrome oxidoreductase complex cytochrome b subunit